MLAFEKAVKATPEISQCYQPGLRALGSNSSKIQPADTRCCYGSVDLDACLQTKYPDDNRWDYLLSYKKKAYFVEVHPAHTSEVDTVLKKLNWLKKWLAAHAPLVDKQKAVKPYYWIASGKANILKTSPHYRRAAQAGLMPVSVLKLV